VLRADDVAAVAQHITSLRNCTDSCCIGEMPAAYERAWPGAADAAQAPALRKILDAPASPAVHAVAALWLSRALDVNDIPRLSRCVDSADPAGAFPTVLVGQQMQHCYPVMWKDKTLGRACIEAIGRITSQSFHSAAEVRAWIAAHADPKNTVDYWQKVLGVTRPAPKELVEQLRQHSPELFFRVVALEPDVLYAATWPMFEQVAKNDIGADRILRLLRKEETWPELASPEHFASFAVTVFNHANGIFEERQGPQLLALWEKKQCCSEDHVRAALVVGTLKLIPEQADRMLTTTLQELHHAQAPVLEALARMYPIRRRAILADWFYGDAAKRAGNEDDLAEAILRGLAQQRMRSPLKLLLDKTTPNPDAPRVIEQLMVAAAAAKYTVPERCRGPLTPPAMKGGSAEEWERAQKESKALRKDCMQGALKYVRHLGGK
jgi:hypothetical protein